MPVQLVNRSRTARKLFQEPKNELAIQRRLNAIYLKVVLRLQPLRLRNKKKLKAALTVVFVDKVEAKKINKQFRLKDYATDVLSFDGFDSSDLGELIICPEVIIRQSKEHKITPQQELTYMLIHGILHLLGYDHEASKSEEKLMFSIQDKVFDFFL